MGTQISTSREAVAMANKFKENVYAVIGIHPVHTYSQNLQEEETQFKTRQEIFDYEVYKQLAQNPKVVGIGECGLDYFRLPQNTEHETQNIQQIKQLQKESFIGQMKLAIELDKALVIHSRSSKGTDDACLDILEIFKSEINLSPAFYSGGEGAPSPFKERVGERLRFVLHSYTGSPEVAKMFTDLGAYISFNGIITFDKTGNMEKVLKVVPDDKILLETDCPYLTPVPMRGKRNEPSYVKYIAEKIAQVKNMTADRIAEITTQNAKRFYALT